MSETAGIESNARPQMNPLFLFCWEDMQDAYVLLYPEGVVKLNPTAGGRSSSGATESIPSPR